MKKNVLVKSWNEIASEIPIDDSNREIFAFFNKISSSLKKSKQDYVYKIRFEFGDKIIQKGKFDTENFILDSNEYNITIGQFKRDLNYSDDPLGIVLTNYIEVFTENISSGSKQEFNNYTIPLKIIKSGDLFGLFGTLDYATGVDENRTSRDWHVVAGNISFGIAFPFHNDKENQLLGEDIQKYFSNNSQTTHPIFQSEKRLQPGEHKLKFIKEYVKDWYVDIIYIPAHYLEFLKNNQNPKFENLLLKKGWIESSPLRNVLYEDTTIANIIIDMSKSLKIEHEKYLLNLVYNYLIKASKGKANLLKPLTGQHVIIDALKNFREKNKNYFSTTKCFEPLPFIYDSLGSEKNDWGLLSVYHLPILFNYSIESLGLFVKNLRDIYSAVKDYGTSFDVNKYTLPSITAYGNTGGAENQFVEKQEKIRSNYLSKVFNVEPQKINLSSREFSNIILINAN